MAEAGPSASDSGASPDLAASAASALGSATYEVIRQRLRTHAEQLRERMGQLDARRREVFGSIESKLLQADRITTAHNCIPQDLTQLDHGRFLFGFNVQFGLKRAVELGDVFAVFARDDEVGTFKEGGLDPLMDPRFLTDFKRLYHVYERTVFSKFALGDGHLFMVFRTGAGPGDLAVFKWAFDGDGLRYVDGRAEAEYRRNGFPPAHEFRWQVPDRESYRYGDHPHISIQDRVFVECIGGDLTIKVEDNTATGEGVYSEPVDDRHQKVDDAEIAYALLGHLILLKIRPYKEAAARFFIFNEKLQSAVRVDSLGQSCALLPEDHGLIFPDGYYLATGGLKRFENRERLMVLERVIHAPNGEDSLYVFFAPDSGLYALLHYRLIAQRVDERITCHGFSLFPNGHLVLSRADPAPQKHHTIQLRQTPFHRAGFEPPGRRDAFLHRVGNKEVVRCLAEANEVLTLALRDDPYAELYVDLVRRCDALLDAHPWLAEPDGFRVDDALRQVRAVADQAVDEFDKVRRLQQEAVRQLAEARRRCEERADLVRRAGRDTLEDFVHHLAALRQLRGELITLREVRYVDVPQVTALEESVAVQAEAFAAECVTFLLKPESLEPYRKTAAAQLAAVEQVARAAEGRRIEQAVGEAGGALEMLIEVVNSLKIEDAIETTRIIDGITAVYATLNQVRAALKNRLSSLMAAEGAAQFHAQLKLLGQSAASYLDLCDSPGKCDEYLNRLTVQIEELEGAFAGFEDYTVQLAERRTELYEAFEQRKLALVGQRNQRASALMTAAERILKVIQNRLTSFKTVEEIHAYMASDLMTAKIRETIGQLLELGDAVKADDLQGRIKAVQQEAVRQLKDRQDLFAGGTDVIQLGRHRFNVNTQPLDLTVVQRDGVQHLHLTGTKYFEPITDEAFLATRAVWDQESLSENPTVYRAEYLAWQLLKSLEAGPSNGSGGSEPTSGTARVEAFLGMSAEERLGFVQAFMGPRYSEAYTRGVHDLDAAQIALALASTHVALQLARFHPTARAAAVVFWTGFCPADLHTLWTHKLKGFAGRNRLFPGDPAQRGYIRGLGELIAGFLRTTSLYPEAHAEEAGEYLFHELVQGETFVVSREADRLAAEFQQHLVAKGADEAFRAAREPLVPHPASELELVRDWVRGGLLLHPGSEPHLEEVTAIVFCGDRMPRTPVNAGLRQELGDLRGSHPLISGARYVFDYLDFTTRLRRFEREVVPCFETFHRLKQRLMDQERARLRLDEFRPRVLSSFVRNELIDRAYLPMVGDNLAKQIGAAGAARRTDLMGLLLLISPPGYGKTTLLEYIASRLGLVFVKINGPALGHQVVSLDPEEAGNAAAREEIHRLNLALEMGDNTMICVDDIQHCSPEFLQKFISLCDGQRKIEGVWRGRPRTYDLRGRKVVVVMAGNPYTESGQKFKIPDMLANRADTYNLGDIVGNNGEWFKASYLENCVTSNAVLAPLASRSPQDVRTFIRMAESGDRTNATALEGGYSAQEVEEILKVMRRLVALREIVLKVNLAYIDSAAQADEFRTEPPFRLQGSYRNMNRLAEKVVPVMNDEEIRTLILDHYKGESQTLTTGAEANLLKFKELFGVIAPDEAARWAEIKKTFQRNQITRGTGQDDPVSRVVGQLAAFQTGLDSIGQTLRSGLSREPAPLHLDLAAVERSLGAIESALRQRADPPATAPASVVMDLAPVSQSLEALRETLAAQWRSAVPALVEAGQDGGLNQQVTDGLRGLREDLSRAITAVHSGTMADAMKRMEHEMEMVHSTLATLKDIAARQRDHVRNAEELLATRARQGTVEIELTQEMLSNERAFLEKFHQVLEGAQPQRAGNAGQEPPKRPQPPAA